MRIIIMAGGEGRRLRRLTKGHPKPMAQLMGRPVLEYALEKLRARGFSEVWLTLRYRPGEIIDYFGSGERLGLRLHYVIEDRELGTAGGVALACRDAPGEEAMVLSGDGVWELDIWDFIERHEESGAAATLALCRHREPERFGVCVTDGEGRITEFIEKPPCGRAPSNLVNTGIYLLSPAAIAEIPKNIPYDFGKDLFPRLLARGFRLNGYEGVSYWCDIGTPETFRQCEKDLRGGLLTL